MGIDAETSNDPTLMPPVPAVSYAKMKRMQGAAMAIEDARVLSGVLASGTGGDVEEAIAKARTDGIVIERDYRQQRLILFKQVENLLVRRFRQHRRRQIQRCLY